MLHTLQRSRREREQLQLHSTDYATTKPLPRPATLRSPAVAPSLPLLLHLPCPENQVVDVAERAWLHALNRCLGTGRDHSQIAWKLIADGTSCNQLHDCRQLFLQTTPPPYSASLLAGHSLSNKSRAQCEYFFKVLANLCRRSTWCQQSCLAKNLLLSPPLPCFPAMEP